MKDKRNLNLQVHLTQSCAKPIMMEDLLEIIHQWVHNRNEEQALLALVKLLVIFTLRN